MNAPTLEAVRTALAAVKYPGFSRDIISFGLVKDVQITGTDVVVQMVLQTADPAVPQQIKTESEAALRSVPGIGRGQVRIDIHAPPAAAVAAAAGGGARAGVATGGPGATANEIPGVRNVIAIASGKGGVGKSTLASNLAVALRASGAKVGLCDCDMYGPSIGLMFGSNQRPAVDDDEMILPVERHGIALMSMGFLLDDTAPAILRGPMVTKYTQQFLRQVKWSDLDYLILDLPPGTGDIQLTIVQSVPLAGAVIVTTPQEVALIDARKAASMFAKVNVPVLGIVENMSYFLCPSDGKRYDIFGEGGGSREAARLGVRLLAQVPIDIPTREAGDRGCPIVVALPDGPVARIYEAVASTLREMVEGT